MAQIVRTGTVAGFQLGEFQDDTATAVAVIRECARKAAANGVRVACFPEGFLNGYTRELASARARAIDLCSPRFSTVVTDLSRCSPVLVFGVIEVHQGRLFNTAVLLDRGAVIGIYRKRHPNETCFAAGCELPIFEAAGIRFAVGICADARDIDDGDRLAVEKVDAVFYLLNNLLPSDTASRWRERHIEVLQARAQQTGAWVVSSDVIGTRGAHIAYGCTAAVAPDQIVHQRVPEHHTGTAFVSVPSRQERHLYPPAPASPT